MPAGLVLIHGRAHGARIAAQPAEAVGARGKPPGQIPGLAAANALAVNERWTVSRRLLGPLESRQRDAIVQSLLDYHGSKVKTAESLGVSRATIYRKIHQYGIITPAS
jgi:transcriptional regulator of acetoin/glycerol metabolism